MTVDIICEHPKRGTGKPEIVASFERQSTTGQWVERRHRTRSGKRVRPRLSYVLDSANLSGTVRTASVGSLSPEAREWIVQRQQKVDQGGGEISTEELRDLAREGSAIEREGARWWLRATEREERMSPAALRWIRNHGTPAQREAVADYRESMSLKCKICGATVPVQDFSALAKIMDQLERLELGTVTIPQVRHGLGKKA